MPLLDLPNELILNIFEHLDLASCFRLRQTSHRFHHFTTPRILASADAGVEKLAAIYLAATDGDEELIRGLLSKEPHVSIVVDGNGPRLEGDSPYFIKALLSQGAKSEIYDPRINRPLLHRAVHEADEDLIRLLLERGIDTKIQYDGCTLLRALAISNHEVPIRVARMRLLLEYGADASCFRQINPHIYHAPHESDDMVGVLLECGADWLMRKYEWQMHGFEDFSRRGRLWGFEKVEDLLESLRAPGCGGAQPLDWRTGFTKIDM